MKVLFAVNNENISDAIVKRYQREYKEILSYKNVYYFNAILKEIQKDKSYDRIVISEDLESFSNNNYDAIDKFIFEKLDNISDEAQDIDGNETSIILICSDRHTKGSSFLVKLFGIGIYNALLGSERSMEQVCKLINKPRVKKEAKAYYNIDSEDVNYSNKTEDEVSELEIRNILTHFKKLGKNTDKYTDSFNNIASQYTDEQLKIIINCLPVSVKMVLESESSKYKEVMKTAGIESVRQQVGQQKLKEAERQTGIRINEILDNKLGQPKVSGPIVIPSSVKTSKNQGPKPVNDRLEITIDQKTDKKKVVKKIENASKLEVKRENTVASPKESSMKKKPTSLDDIVSNVTLDNEDMEDEDMEEKKGRGRPKKVVEDEELKAKGKRGRPKKIVENEEENVTLPGFEEDDSFDDLLPGLEMDENTEEVEDGMLPGLDDEEFDDDVSSNDDISTDDEFDDDMLPGFNDFDDEESEEETSLSNVEEGEEAEEVNSDEEFDDLESDEDAEYEEVEEVDSDEEFDDLESDEDAEYEEVEEVDSDEESGDLESDEDVEYEEVEEVDSDEESGDLESDEDAEYEEVEEIDSDEESGDLESDEDVEYEEVEEIESDEEFDDLESDDDVEYEEVEEVDSDEEFDDIESEGEELEDIESDEDVEYEEIEEIDESEDLGDEEFEELEEDEEYTDEVELPELDELEDFDEEIPMSDDLDDETLPGMDDMEDESLPGMEEIEDEDASLPDSDDDLLEDYNEEVVAPVAAPTPSQNIETVKPRVDYSMSSLNSLLTKDKKIATFIGTTKNGTSFIINNMAALFASLGINTAILDMTKNKNSYYIYTNNQEDLRNIAFNSMSKLQKGFAEGIKVDKNLTVYTALPNDGKDYSDAEPILSTIIQNHSLVLIDCDYDTDPSYFAYCQEIYLVQSMDVLTIQPLTAFLRDLKAQGVLETEKIRVVINKELPVKGLTSKSIIGGMSFYNDPSMSFMTELFNKDMVKACSIPFDQDAYSKYLYAMAECKVSISGYSKQFLTKLKNLGDMIYPLGGKK